MIPISVYLFACIRIYRSVVLRQKADFHPLLVLLEEKIVDRLGTVPVVIFIHYPDFNHVLLIKLLWKGHYLLHIVQVLFVVLSSMPGSRKFYAIVETIDVIVTTL